MGFEGLNSPEQKEGIRRELLSRGRGREAIRYAFQEGPPFGDDDTLSAEGAAPHESEEIFRWRFG